MEESCEILMKSLSNSGVTIPAGVSSISDLTPSALLSVCSQALRLIDPTSFPEQDQPQEQLSISRRFNLSSHLASAFKSLGFIGDITFRNFLYPSEDDLYRLLRFLVERLPGEQDANHESPNVQLQALATQLDDFDISDSEEGALLDSFQMSCKVLSLQCQEELLMVEFNKRSSELQALRDELDLRKSAVEMACDPTHPISFYQEKISNQVQLKKQNLLEAELRWEATKASMEEECIALEESVAAKSPEAYKEIEQVKEIELEMESVLAAIKQRDEELLKLHSDLEKQPKLASRKSYIERIKEITKNSRKQDIDIERILKETRELQLESNSIQESLHRTYSVVDETVFREAKKDPGGQQHYRLLASIHENFEQMAENIIAADRTRREVADYEAKLAAITSRSLNVDKLKADLDAIRKENELLEQRINHI